MKYKILILNFIVMFILWGCSNAKAPKVSDIKKLEKVINKEEDTKKNKEVEVHKKASDKANKKVTEKAEEPKKVVEEQQTEKADTDSEQYKVQSNPSYNGKYRVDVNRVANTVTVYTRDKNGNYNVPYKAFVCSTGGENTPLGDYYMPARKQKVGLLFYNVWGMYTSDIVGNILFHSVPAKSADPNTIIGEEYNKLGTTASHGCIRLSVPDAKWIMENCGTGTWVHIYDSNDPGPLGKPIPLKMKKEIGPDPHYE